MSYLTDSMNGCINGENSVRKIRGVSIMILVRKREAIR